MGRPERVQPGDRFHIGSCTKSMTATLAAMLVERGTLSWETTVGDLFPDLLGKIHAGYHRVTLLQFLLHRSGLPEDRTLDPTIWPRVRALRGPIWDQRRALLEIVLARPPAAAAGGRGCCTPTTAT